MLIQHHESTVTGSFGHMSNTALALYRSILRAARLLPTEHRRMHVCRKARKEFEESREVSQERRSFLLALGETQLDNIEAQAKHLQELVATGKLRW